MKNILLTILLVITSFKVNAQARVTSSGISIQGIAKNAADAALTNQAVPIVVTIYYTVNSTNYTITSQTGTVNTDAYGFFAYVVNISSDKFLGIANTEAYIKVAANGVVFVRTFPSGNTLLQVTDSFLVGRNDQVLGFEHDDRQPLSGWQVTR